MKKLITFLVVFCLMIAGASALERYTGTPQLPYLIYGHVEWNEQMLSGARLETTNQNTGFTQQITTDNNGYWQQEGGNWLTSSAGRPPIMYGDIIKVKVLDGCGTGDTCEKSFSAYTDGYKDYAVIDLSITGELSCPPISCPSCNCGGGGGSSGGGGTVCDYSYSKEICENKYPCVEIVCPKPITCPEEKVCPEEKICPTVDICPEEKVCPDCDGMGFFIILTMIFGAAVGGTGIYFFKKGEAVVKGVGIKTYVSTDGKVKILHRHFGILGYHNPETSHRVTYERHPKGEMTPLYEKDENGVYKYVQ